MINVSILGGSGYTGFELLRILGAHPEAEVITVTSRQHKGLKVTDVFPSLNKLQRLKFDNTSNLKAVLDTDIVFSALPHHVAMEIVPKLLSKGKRVIDLSADFRLKDAAVYEKWYGKHIAKDLLKKAVYGLPELYRDKIKGAVLVANPGCYPTGAIIGIAPLLKEGIIDPDAIIIDSKSGVSGAGRAASLDTSFAEVNEGFKAYKVGEHRHTPEIEQEFSLIAKKDIKIIFTPHLLPVTRGILSTIYTSITKKGMSYGKVFDIYKRHYSNEYFVRIMPQNLYPNISYVRGSNFCDVGLRVDDRTGHIIVITAIDNLIKGASGQAVQSMNIMFGIDEAAGLTAPPSFL